MAGHLEVPLLNKVKILAVILRSDNDACFCYPGAINTGKGVVMKTWYKHLGCYLIWSVAACGSGTTSRSVCTTGADCFQADSSVGALRDLWCVAETFTAKTGYCARVPCTAIGTQCRTGGVCVVADDLDRTASPPRQGHCEKTDCIAVFCPVLLECSKALWCEYGVIGWDEIYR